MNTISNFNEIKTGLIELLQSYKLTEHQIDLMLTDDFISGLSQIMEQEPENDSFLNLARNLTSEENLVSLSNLNKAMNEALCKDSYFSVILQYILDKWKNVDIFSENLKIMPLSNNGKISSDDAMLGRYAAGAAMWATKVPSPAKAVIGEALIYGEIVVRVKEQEEKVWDAYRKITDELEGTPLHISQLYSTAETTTSPLVVDLDGDGVETISTQAGVHFDHDSNGFAEKTGWVGRDDGLLVRDINGNGQIDDGTELFGNNSVLSNGQKAANGFEALKDLDSNGDGVFNIQDTAWNGVKVWKDSNQNGIVDQDELLTLEQAGISEFDLNYQSQPIKDANGNQHKQTSTITKADGTTSTVTDVWFESDHANTVDKADVVIPEEIKNLPEVAGFGNVHSLQTAMALDSTGKLKALIEEYTTETNAETRSALLDQIIYHWAGVQDKDPNGRDPTQVYGKVIDDCRKLEALEEFMGKDYLGTWCWGDRDPNPHGRAAPFILQAWDVLKTYINNSLLPQTVYKSTLESITLTYNTQTEKWEADVSTITTAWASAFATDAESTLTMMKEFAGILKNFGAMALPVLSAIRSYGDIEGSTYQKELLNFGQWEANGTDGDDALYGDDADDYLNGGKGNDNLFGNNGNDLLVGGEGNDYLIGGNGKDIYHFEPGFGNDCIDNMQDESQPNEDIIRFGEGISPDKVTLGRQGFDLIITVAYDPDEEGNTRPNDSIRVYSYFDKQGTTSATISAIKFTDETSWGYDYISTHWNSVPDVNGGITNEGDNNDNSLSGTDANDILIGNSGNDYLNGYGGNDLLLGGKGNDHLDGGAGDDTYLYNLGDGLDTIFDYANHDKISFGEGICFEDLTFSLVNYNYLKITIKGDENQGIIIQNYNAALDYKIEDLYFYDGTVVHLSEIPLTYHQNDKDEEGMLINNQFSGNNTVETIEFHDGTTLDISNADQLIQAMSIFGVAQGAADNSLSNPTQDVNEMYNLAINNDITQKAV